MFNWFKRKPKPQQAVMSYSQLVFELDANCDLYAYVFFRDNISDKELIGMANLTLHLCNGDLFDMIQEAIKLDDSIAGKKLSSALAGANFGKTAAIVPLIPPIEVFQKRSRDDG